MSFSVDTKNELARIMAKKPCCQMAELAAIIKMDGLIRISGRGQVSLQVITESAPVARKVFTYLKSLFGVHTDILIKKKTRLKKNNVYIVTMPPQDEVSKVLEASGLLAGQGVMPDQIKPELVRRDCCRRSYLRGVFLGGGSVNNPEGNYHLEILVNDEDFGAALCGLMKRYGLAARINSRKNWDVIYLKGSEEIIKLLNLMGAHNALLNFENVRIYKDMRNQVNRLVNCETANLNKTVNAALRQVADIRFIDETIGLAKLPRNLRTVAELRMNYPDISLKELGEMLEPQIGKSGVNHRIRRLQRIADKIREQKTNAEPAKQ